MILSVQDIFCCILNTLFKSKIWAKIDELVQERDHTKQCSSSCEKKRRKKQGELGLIASSFILSHRPSLPKKAIVRYRFRVQLGTIAVLFSGTVCPASIRKTKSLATFRQMLSVSVNGHGIQ